MGTNKKVNKKVVLAKALPALSKCAVNDTAHLEEGNSYVCVTDVSGLTIKEKRLVMSEKAYKFEEMAGEIAISNAVYFDCITRDSRFKSEIAVFMNGDEDIHCVGIREFKKWGVTSIKNVIVPISIVAKSDYDKIISDVTSDMTAEIKAAGADTKATKAETANKTKKAVKTATKKTKAVTDEVTA